MWPDPARLVVCLDTTSNSLTLLAPLPQEQLFRLTLSKSHGLASMIHCHWTAHVHSALSESLLGTDPQHQLTKRYRIQQATQATCKPSTPNILLMPTLTEPWRMMSAVTLSPSVTMVIKWITCYFSNTNLIFFTRGKYNGSGLYWRLVTNGHDVHFGGLGTIFHNCTFPIFMYPGF